MQTKPKARHSCFSSEEDKEDSSDEEEDAWQANIGWPTSVQHKAHVTFDPFEGYLGLPQDFENKVPKRLLSASKSVFGVSPASMQCSFDGHGNSVPTFLLLLQTRLYNQGGLRAEGIFRVAARIDHEEHVRKQLNDGVVPKNMEVYALAGLIKAWFRELPDGVLDSLPDSEVEAVSNSGDVDAATELVEKLPDIQKNLLDWTLNLMVDVVEFETVNLMNIHNIATVFAPNLFQLQILDPKAALSHAADVMKLLKLLVQSKLQSRQEKLAVSAFSEAFASARSSTILEEDDDDGEGEGDGRRQGMSGMLEMSQELFAQSHMLSPVNGLSLSREQHLPETLPVGFVLEGEEEGKEGGMKAVKVKEDVLMVGEKETEESVQEERVLLFTEEELVEDADQGAMQEEKNAEDVIEGIFSKSNCNGVNDIVSDVGLNGGMERMFSIAISTTSSLGVEGVAGHIDMEGAFTPTGRDEPHASNGLEGAIGEYGMRNGSGLMDVEEASLEGEGGERGGRVEESSSVVVQETIEPVNYDGTAVGTAKSVGEESGVVEISEQLIVREEGSEEASLEGEIGGEREEESSSVVVKKTIELVEYDESAVGEAESVEGGETFEQLKLREEGSVGPLEEAAMEDPAMNVEAPALIVGEEVVPTPVVGEEEAPTNIPELSAVQVDTTNAEIVDELLNDSEVSGEEFGGKEMAVGEFLSVSGSDLLLQSTSADSDDDLYPSSPIASADEGLGEGDRETLKQVGENTEGVKKREPSILATVLITEEGKERVVEAASSSDSAVKGSALEATEVNTLPETPIALVSDFSNVEVKGVDEEDISSAQFPERTEGNSAPSIKLEDISAGPARECESQNEQEEERREETSPPGERTPLETSIAENLAPVVEEESGARVGGGDEEEEDWHLAEESPTAESVSGEERVERGGALAPNNEEAVPSPRGGEQVVDADSEGDSDFHDVNGFESSEDQSDAGGSPFREAESWHARGERGGERVEVRVSEEELSPSGGGAVEREGKESRGPTASFPPEGSVDSELQQKSLEEVVVLKESSEQGKGFMIDSNTVGKLANGVTM